jgi:hypothetical protein
VSTEERASSYVIIDGSVAESTTDAFEVGARPADVHVDDVEGRVELERVSMNAGREWRVVSVSQRRMDEHQRPRVR